MKKFISLLLAFTLFLCPVSVNASSEEGEEMSVGSIYNVSLKDMHPELRFAGALIRLILPHFTEGFFNMANLFLDNIGLPDLTRGINSEVLYIERADGTRLRMRVYSPKEISENVPGVLWIHGGGYALGVPETEIPFVEMFVKEKGAVVVAPDYTNSPTAPYPAALDDCYAALLWLRVASIIQTRFLRGGFPPSLR